MQKVVGGLISQFEDRKREVAAEIERQGARLLSLQEEHNSFSGKVCRCVCVCVSVWECF